MTQNSGRSFQRLRTRHCINRDENKQNIQPKSQQSEWINNSFFFHLPYPDSRSQNWSKKIGKFLCLLKFALFIAVEKQIF